MFRKAAAARFGVTTRSPRHTQQRCTRAIRGRQWGHPTAIPSVTMDRGHSPASTAGTAVPSRRAPRAIFRIASASIRRRSTPAVSVHGLASSHPNGLHPPRLPRVATCDTPPASGTVPRGHRQRSACGVARASRARDRIALCVDFPLGVNHGAIDVHAALFPAAIAPADAHTARFGAFSAQRACGVAMRTIRERGRH